MKKRLDKVIKVTLVIVKKLEIFLAIMIIAGVVINSAAVFPFLTQLFTLNGGTSYELFQDFLSFVLLLIIGLELALMLIRHTVSSVIQVMIYAVARKMLIYNTTSADILLGALALLILFLVNKYFVIKEEEIDIK